MKNVILAAKSDTIQTPDFSQHIVSSSATSTTANKLVDLTQTFTETAKIGDIVYNYTDTTIAVVTAIDSDTTLSLSADIMASGEVYKLHREKTSKGYKLLIGGAGNINCVTAGGDSIVISGVAVGVTDFEIVHLKSTSTTATNISYIY